MRPSAAMYAIDVPDQPAYGLQGSRSCGQDQDTALATPKKSSRPPSPRHWMGSHGHDANGVIVDADSGGVVVFDPAMLTQVVVGTNSHVIRTESVSSRANRHAAEGALPHYPDPETLKAAYLPLAVSLACARIIGLSGPGQAHRVSGGIILAIGAVLLVAEALSLLLKFDELEHGSVVIIALAWSTYNWVSLATFVFRFSAVTHGWIFACWKSVWKTETDVSRSSFLHLLLLLFLGAAVIGNMTVTVLARWTNLSDDGKAVFKEIFVIDLTAVQIVFTVYHLIGTVVFLVPVILFLDVCRSLTTRIDRLHYAAISVGRTLTELTQDLKELSEAFEVINYSFGPWLCAVFGIELPLIVFCLVSLLDYASLDALTIIILIMWAGVNLVVTAIIVIPAARAHGRINDLEAEIALHMDSNASLADRSDFIFLSTTLAAHQMGIRIGGSSGVVITSALVSQGVSFIGSFYLLLVGFRTS